MPRIAPTLGLVLAAGLALPTLPALGGPTPLVIYSEITTSSTSAVSGVAGRTIESIDRPYRSLTGNYWILRVNMTGTTTDDDLIITGQGNTPGTVIREGVTAIDAARTGGEFEQRVAVNDSGEFAFSNNLSGATTTDDETMIKSNAAGTAFTVVAREATAIPAVGGVSHGTTMSSPSITNGGDVAYRSLNTTPSPTTTYALRTNGTVLDVRTGATIPTGQQGTLPNSTWQNLSTNDYIVSADGSKYLAFGDTNGSTSPQQDDVVVINGAVVVQEGFAIPGASTTTAIDAILEAGMNPAGRWFTRGSLAGASTTTDVDFVVIDGAVAAYTGDFIKAGSGERWATNVFADTFFGAAVDNQGNFVLGGVTDNADALRNGVLVYNNVFEIIREGDAVDLNGDGLLNDDAFINAFGNDDMILEGLDLFFVTTLKNAAGTTLGDAYIHIVLPAPGAAALAGLAGLAALRRRRR